MTRLARLCLLHFDSAINTSAPLFVALIRPGGDILITEVPKTRNERCLLKELTQ